MTSKAILILDMPIDCRGCDMFYVDKDFWRYRCKANYDESLGDESVRQSWCPLKPLPQKKEVKEIKLLEDFVFTETRYDIIANKIIGKINYDVETIFNKGYNKCIAELLGEE